MMIIFILLCFITGFFFLNFVIKKIDLSTIILFSFPVGIVLHTILFLLLSFFGIYYNKYLFIFFSLITILSLLKKRINIKNDIKKIPIYYFIFLGFIIFRLILMANTGFFEFYNYDEFTAYQTGSTITYLSHGFVEIYQTYAPINYFTGVMSLEFVGLSVTAVRIISVIFFALTSLFIYKALREKKVNVHISSLIAMIFLVSSSEMLQLAKGFYTNIFFMFYFLVGVYGIIDYYFIKKEKGFPILQYLMIIGLMLTRREAIYFTIIFILILSIYLLVKKMINKSRAIVMNSLPIIFIFIWGIMEKIFNFDASLYLVSEEKMTIVERLINRFQNMGPYLKNMYEQTFSSNYYYYNYAIYLTFGLVIVIIIYKFLRKKKDDLFKFSLIIFFFELVYLAMILSTQFIIFNSGEFAVAASFSRYTIVLMAVNFILIGILLFNNTDWSKKKMKKVEETKTDIINDPKVVIIIPAYNEEKNILKAYKSIISFNKNSDLKYDVIVINDGSTDTTEEVLIKNSIPHITLVRNLGIGGAVQTGYKYAFRNNYDIAVQFDGDGQHDVNCVSDLIKPIIDGKAELVIGSRFIDKKSETFKSSFLRRVGIKIISITMKIVTKKKIYDTTSGFRACNKKIIKEFSIGYPVEYPEPISTVSVVKENHIVDEVPVNMNEREGGVSSINSWKTVYYMINVFMSIIVVGIRRKK